MRDLSEDAAVDAEDGGGGCGRLGLSMTMVDWRKRAGARRGGEWGEIGIWGVRKAVGRPRMDG